MSTDLNSKSEHDDSVVHHEVILCEGAMQSRSVSVQGQVSTGPITFKDFFDALGKNQQIFVTKK